MKKITYTEVEIRRNALDAMKRCVDNLQVGNRRMAMINSGEADVWSEIYTECTGVYLEAEDGNYQAMLEIYENAEREWEDKAEAED